MNNKDAIEIINYDLGPEAGVIDHDAICVSQASKLLQIGYLEYETAVYGSAYYKDGEIYYYISAKEDTMEKFQKTCYQSGISPTPAKYFFKRYDLIEETEEEIKQRFRLSAAQSLRESYPRLFFEALTALTASENTNAAFPIVQALTHQLDSCFDLNQLNLFGELIDRLFRGRLLTRESTLLFKQWLEKEYEKISVEPIASGDYRRTYAGFAYKKPNETMKSLIDAFPYMAREKQTSFLAKGCLVTPLLTITYYADSFNNLRNSRDIFKKELESYLGPLYIQLMERLHQLPAGVDQDLYFSYLERIKTAGSPLALDSFLYYGHLWNVRF